MLCFTLLFVVALYVKMRYVILCIKRLLIEVGYGGKDLRKRKVLSLEWKSEGVMDDESGELVELMEEVPLKELGDAELERLVRG